MTEYQLKYGCNPNQTPSRIFMRNKELPLEILNGHAGYINFLDALNSYQLVRELKEATGLASAASFKHVSPAGVGVCVPLDDTLKKMYFAEDNCYSDIATAYIRARGGDRISSYGDFVALSDECDEQTAKYLLNEVSDGIIAPSYSIEALDVLKKKRKGNYLVIKIDANYVPNPIETKDVFGITFEQARNEIKITNDLLNNVVTNNQELTQDAKRDLIIAQIALKYTQSNSVCYAVNGQTIGIGAGQQSRIHCTRLAGDKADLWWLRHHPKVLNLAFKDNIKRYDKDNSIDLYLSKYNTSLLTEWDNTFMHKPNLLTTDEKNDWIAKMSNISLGSDAFFPFGDNIERAAKSGVKYVAQAGGSIRDSHVISTCNKYNIVMALTGVRLFHH